MKRFLVVVLICFLLGWNIGVMISNEMLKVENKNLREEIKIPLPPLDIQQKIVADYQNVENQILSIQQQIQTQKTLINAVLAKCKIVNAEFQNTYAMKLEEVARELEPVLNDYAKEKGFDIVFKCHPFCVKHGCKFSKRKTETEDKRHGENDRKCRKRRQNENGKPFFQRHIILSFL